MSGEKGKVNFSVLDKWICHIYPMIIMNDKVYTRDIDNRLVRYSTWKFYNNPAVEQQVNIS